MPLCTLADIQDHLLPVYTAACEEQNPGIAERTIDKVSGEITDLLAYRYPGPWPNVPQIVRYIASVIAAYRMAGGITTLVTTEGTTDNEWLPLQKDWRRATEMLDEIASGKRKLPLESLDEEREDAAVAVMAPLPTFNFKGF